MSIYRLYIQNGNCAGFWIHIEPGRTSAQVVSINGRNKGGLPEGASMQADGVQVRWFDVRSGRSVSTSGSIDRPEDNGFVRIAEPPWNFRSRSSSLRPVS